MAENNSSTDYEDAILRQRRELVATCVYYSQGPVVYRQRANGECDACGQPPEWHELAAAPENYHAWLGGFDAGDWQGAPA